MVRSGGSRKGSGCSRGKSSRSTSDDKPQNSFRHYFRPKPARNDDAAGAYIDPDEPDLPPNQYQCEFRLKEYKESVELRGRDDLETLHVLEFLLDGCGVGSKFDLSQAARQIYYNADPK